MVTDCIARQPKSWRTCIEQGEELVRQGATHDPLDWWCTGCLQNAREKLGMLQALFTNG